MVISSSRRRRRQLEGGGRGCSDAANKPFSSFSWLLSTLRPLHRALHPLAAAHALHPSYGPSPPPPLMAWGFQAPPAPSLKLFAHCVGLLTGERVLGLRWMCLAIDKRWFSEDQIPNSANRDLTGERTDVRTFPTPIPVRRRLPPHAQHYRNPGLPLFWRIKSNIYLIIAWARDMCCCSFLHLLLILSIKHCFHRWRILCCGSRR